MEVGETERTVRGDGPYKSVASVVTFIIKPMVGTVNFVEESTGDVNGKHLTLKGKRSIMSKL